MKVIQGEWEREAGRADEHVLALSYTRGRGSGNQG